MGATCESRSKTMTTVTTVGYGDSYRRTDLGRSAPLIVMLLRMFVALLTAAALRSVLTFGA